MNVATSREFASFLETNMFESPQLSGLIADIRQGAYAPGRHSAPFVGLRISLAAMDPPPHVLERLAELETQARTATTLTDDDLAEALEGSRRMREQGGGVFVVPSAMDPDDVLDAAGDLLLPDSKFISATMEQADAEARRELAHGPRHRLTAVLTNDEEGRVEQVGGD